MERDPVFTCKISFCWVRSNSFLLLYLLWGCTESWKTLTLPLVGKEGRKSRFALKKGHKPHSPMLVRYESQVKDDNYRSCSGSSHQHVPFQSISHSPWVPSSGVCDKTNLALSKGCNGVISRQTMMATEGGACSAACFSKAQCIHFFPHSVTLKFVWKSYDNKGFQCLVCSRLGSVCFRYQTAYAF